MVFVLLVTSFMEMSNADVFLIKIIKDDELLLVFRDGILSFESYCRLKLNRLRCIKTEVGSYEFIHDAGLNDLLRCIFQTNQA